MGWKVVERRIGRAGAAKRRMARQREWDRAYGEGNWDTGYLIQGDFVSQEAALESIYYASYELHSRSTRKTSKNYCRLHECSETPTQKPRRASTCKCQRLPSFSTATDSSWSGRSA